MDVSSFCVHWVGSPPCGASSDESGVDRTDGAGQIDRTEGGLSPKHSTAKSAPVIGARAPAAGLAKPIGMSPVLQWVVDLSNGSFASSG